MNTRLKLPTATLALLLVLSVRDVNSFVIADPAPRAIQVIEAVVLLIDHDDVLVIAQTVLVVPMPEIIKQFGKLELEFTKISGACH
jgi:hypothetical protein